MWRLWAKALGEKSGKTDDESNKIACIRTVIVLSYITTNLFIIAGVIRHWWYMNSKEKEILDITQEECAEVIVAISKINRFGIDNFKPGKPKTNREHLAEELGDLQAMIDLCIQFNLVGSEQVSIAADNKIAKLKQWSNIFYE